MKKTNLIAAGLLAFALGYCFMLFGGDAPNPGDAIVNAPSSAETTEISGVMKVVIALGAAFMGVLSWILHALVSMIKGKDAKSEAEEHAWEALETGVTSAYHDLYESLKNAAKDGKLSAEEKRQLRDYAIQKAREVATGPGLELLKETALPRLHDWVERIVKGRKAEAAQ